MAFDFPREMNRRLKPRSPPSTSSELCRVHFKQREQISITPPPDTGLRSCSLTWISPCPVATGHWGCTDMVPYAERRAGGSPPQFIWLSVSHLELMISPDYCCGLDLNFLP